MNSSTFPSLTTKDKGEDWHKKFVQAIVKETIDSNYDFYNASITELYNYYNGTQTGDEWKFLQESEDGDVLPAKWVNYNKIRTKVDLLLGEMAEKGYEISAETINAGSKVRKFEERRELLTQIKVNRDLLALQSEFGLPIADDNLPESEEDVYDYFDYEYRDIYEIIMSTAIKYCGKRYNLDNIRMEWMRDIIVSMRCFAKSEITGDFPTLRRIDPRNMVFDTSAEDPFLSDSTYFGEVRYMSVADAAEQYGVDKEELEKLYEDMSNKATLGNRNVSLAINDGAAVEAFKREGNELKVMVFSGVWQDTKPFNFKESEDKHGNLHFKMIGDREEKDKDKQKTHKKRIKIWRKATLLANEIVRDWGEVENTPREIDNITDTPCPYIGVIPAWINQKATSIVEQLKGLQDLKNIAFYNIQLAMARAGGKGFIYDLSQIPEDWAPEEVMKYLKNTGIAFIDSAKDGVPSQYNQFGTIDLSISPSVQFYMEISKLLDYEMEQISGINEAREGIVQSSSQTVGVTQSALIQSNLKTKMLFSYFDGFMNKCLNHQGGLVKISWENKEIFAPIIGDVGVDFLSQEVDVDLQDYSIFIEYIPSVLRDRSSLENITLAALQSQQISFVDAMKILKEKDIVLAINKLEKSVMRREKDQARQAQMQVQMEQQLQQQQMQAQAQAEAGKQDVQREKMNTDKQIALAKGKVDLLKSINK